MTRATHGDQAARIAAELKTPFMPWQRQVADVALEVDPSTGRLAYREVRLTVPRQSGKTTLLLALILHRALGASNQTIAYTAQTGNDARKKWEHDWLPVLDDSRFSNFYRKRLKNGDEGLAFVNGSWQGLLASTEKGGHGGSPDLAIADEAFAIDFRVEQAMKPALRTRPEPQFWVVSTAGTPMKSPYLYAKVLGGRKLVEQGSTRGVAYFEWSAPEDADPYDRRAWWDCSPALGFTTTEDSMAADMQSMLDDPKQGLSEFRRAYLNQWVLAMGDPIIPLDHWQSLGRPGAPKPPWVMLGLSVAPEDGSAALVACGEDLTGLQSMVVEHGQGVDWLFPSEADPVGALGRQIDRFTTESEGRPFVVVAEKSVAHLVSELERVVGFDRLIVRKGAQLPAVCAFWLRACKSSLLTHCGEPELQVALAGAERRFVGGAWVWNHEKSGADVTPLEAQGLAASGFMGHWGEDIGE